MYNKQDCKSFDVFGRVISGTVRHGEELRIMGEGFTLDEQEDLFVKKVGKLFVMDGRDRREVRSVAAGNMVLIEGIDLAITKTATIISNSNPIPVSIMRPIKFWTTPVTKIAI